MAKQRSKEVEPPGVKEQLREAIKASGQSLQELGRVTGVKADRLSRFIRGERGLSLDAVESLCRTLGLQLSSSGRPPRGTSK